NAILKVLTSHSCFSYLPKDVRTLLKTPSITREIVQLEDGEYLHIGFKASIIAKLSNMHSHAIPSSLEIDISTDRAQLHRNGKIQIWPFNFELIMSFQFENKIPFIRKYIRKPHLPLQQFMRRMSEYHGQPIYYEKLTMNNHIRVSQSHESGPLIQDIICLHCKQYRKLECNNMTFNLRLNNNCCLLKCSSICLIQNILVPNGQYYLIIKKFKYIKDLYDVGILSDQVGFFVCSELLDNEMIPFTNVVTKCYRMPLFEIDKSDSSDSDEGIDTSNK
ncbi:hypothetical protein X777_06121, partial [Ooceraea biroi]